MNNKVKNMILNLQVGKDLLDKNRSLEKCSGVPQLAFLMKTENNEIVGKPFINSSIRKECREDWMKSRELSHAEVRLMKWLEDEGLLENNIGYSMVISSHPCEHCIKLLSNYENKIDNVYYISKSSYMRKIKEYNELIKVDNGKQFDEIKINFQRFNSYGNEEIDSLTDYYMKVLDDFLVRKIDKLLIFLESNLVDNKCCIDKSDYKEWKFFLDTFHHALNKRIYTTKKEQVNIEYFEILENKNKILSYMKMKK